MAGELKLRRGTTSQHEVFTGAQAEVTVDTDTNSLVVHDGVTPGGFRVPNEEAFSAGDVTVSGFSGGKYEAIASGNTLTIIGTPVDELTGEPKFHVGHRVFCEGEARTITEVATAGGNTVVTVTGTALVEGVTDVYLATHSPVLGALPIEFFGGGSQVADNAQAFVASAKAQGVVVLSGGEYRFPTPVLVDFDVRVECNGSTLLVGDADARADTFVLAAGCDRFEFRGLGGVEILSPLEEGGRVHDLITSFQHKDGTFGFPQGDNLVGHLPQKVVIEHNAFGAARVSLGTTERDPGQPVDGITYRENSHESSDPVYTYLLYLSDTVWAKVTENSFRCLVMMIDPNFEDNADAVKITGSEGRYLEFSSNYVEGKSPASPVQVDIFTGGYGARIISNTFVHAHLHRKVTAMEGEVPLIDCDIVSGNVFEINSTYSLPRINPMYYSGQGGIISLNQFRMKELALSPDTLLIAIHFDDNGAFPTTPDGEFSSSNTLVVSGNLIDMTGCTGGDLVAAFLVDPGQMETPPEKKPTFVNNVVRGGDRFLQGWGGIGVGNQWTTERTPQGYVNFFTAAGNSFPVPVTGRTDSAPRVFSDVPSGGQVPVENVTYIRALEGDTINELLNGVAGQQVTIYARVGPATVVHSNSIRLKGETNASMPTRSTLTLLRVPDQDISGGEWQEISRSF